MKNWQTSLAGILTAAGLGMIGSGDDTVKLIGQICSVLGSLLLGLAAKQHNVSGGTVPQASSAEVKAAVTNDPTYTPPTKKELAQ